LVASDQLGPPAPVDPAAPVAPVAPLAPAGPAFEYRLISAITAERVSTALGLEWVVVVLLAAPTPGDSPIAATAATVAATVILPLIAVGLLTRLFIALPRMVGVS